jgi:diaminopimelate epimerase
MRFVKAHALGNDFLLVENSAAPEGSDRPGLTRRLCDRHRGIGADGVMFFTETADGASMQLLNADGSPSEVSGNGVRCLAAWLAKERAVPVGTSLAIHTDAGVKRLRLEAVNGPRLTFRAAMGSPEHVRQRTLDVDGKDVDVVTLRVGNPQCVVLGEVSDARLRTLAARLAVHSTFPEGSNVELATVEGPDRVRILIWERGVGPTQASGTGACAAAVAAMTYGGASPDIQVESPGGTQRVELRADGLYLTGWAEVICDGRWLL